MVTGQPGQRHRGGADGRDPRGGRGDRGGALVGLNQQNVRAARFYAKHASDMVGTKRFLVGDHWHDDHIRERSLSEGEG
jgi:hypothetical protein